MVNREFVIICDFGEDLGECPFNTASEDFECVRGSIDWITSDKLKRELYCRPCLEAMKVRELKEIKSAIQRLEQ